MSDKNQLFHLSCNKKALLRFVNQAINSIFAKYHTYPFPHGRGLCVASGLQRHPGAQCCAAPRQN